MAASYHQPGNAISAVLFLSFCIIFTSEANANLLDPTLMGRELQTFARDALGVDEMQVGSPPESAEEVTFFSIMLRR